MVTILLRVGTCCRMRNCVSVLVCVVLVQPCVTSRAYLLEDGPDCSLNGADGGDGSLLLVRRSCQPIAAA